MPSPPNDLIQALRALGLSASGLDRIKFGNGVVGKLTTTLMGLLTVCLGAVAVGAYLQNIWIVGGGLAVAAAGYLFNAMISMDFAKKNPGIALLEGAELVQYHQLEMAAKELPQPPTQPNIESPVYLPREISLDG